VFVGILTGIAGLLVLAVAWWLWRSEVTDVLYWHHRYPLVVGRRAVAVVIIKHALLVVLAVALITCAAILI
jgi:hypothetical protein